MRKRKVMVTGMGAVSALGLGVEANVAGLRSGNAVFAPARLLRTSLTLPVAEVPLSNRQLAEMAGVGPEGGVCRSFLLALLAAREALGMAGVSEPGSCLLVTSTTGAGVEVCEDAYRDFDANVSGLSFFHAGEIPRALGRHLGVRGRQFCNSTACASSANGILLAARLIAAGMADRVLVGGFDAQSRFSLNGFNSLEILSPTGCRPFSSGRNGTTLGEAAAFLVLESEAAAAGKRIYGRVAGYANVNEAYHATSSSPNGEGALRAIKGALDRARLRPEDVDYVNAHGTGTLVNDLSESLALSQVFGNSVPVSSTKGFTGHTLAACGALEAAFSLLAIREQVVWPNCGLGDPMPEAGLHFAHQCRPAVVGTVLSNSFGFGGNTTSLVFTKN